MIGIVIVTHGRLAQETIVAMEHMVGPQPNLRAVSIGPEDDIERPCREGGAAASFQSRVMISKDGQCVDARSIMGLMMLAASPGTEIVVEADGPDAAAALAAIVALAKAKFGED